MVDVPQISLFQVPVLPIGNLLSSDSVTFIKKRHSNLGFFALLPDALIVLILDTIATTTSSAEALTAAKSLSQFSATSTFMHALSSDDDLWRRLAFSLFTPFQLSSAPFINSWRATVHRLLFSSPSSRKQLPSVKSPSSSIEQRAVTPFYSDILFHKRRCRTVDIDESWLLHDDDIPRISGKDLSIATFQKQFETPRRPVILTDIVNDWPAFNDWDPSALAKILGETPFNAGGFPFTFSQYLEYSDAIHASDDQALYIFDNNFAKKTPQLADSYTVPSLFTEDLFSVLGEEKRPDFRWLIAGPRRSGSSFHKDPNATSAWNAAIKGRKKWVFFPPDVTPPGITPTSDGSDVTAPLSVIEWFVNFYNRDVIESCGGLEAVVNPGELMFVPRGWWHCVLNLDFSIAITQNFVSSVNVEAVVRWIKQRPEQISGCKSSDDADFLRRNFPALVVKRHPHLKGPLAFAFDDENDEKRLTCDPVKKHKLASGLWQSLQTTTSTTSLSETTNGGNSLTSSSSSPRRKFSFGF